MAKIIKMEYHQYTEYIDTKGAQWVTETAIGKDVGATKCNVVMITKKAGFEPLSIMHYHQEREEIFIVIEGKAKGIVNNSEIILEPGIVVFIPAGEKHYLHLRALPIEGKIFKMIEIGSTIEDEDIWVGESQEIAENLIKNSVLHSSSER